MKLNLSIPGQISIKEVEALCRLAESIKGPGVVVEAGSLCGLSSWHWSKNVNDQVQVICIDPWKREPWIVRLVEEPLKIGPFGKHIFDHHTADCNNIIAVQGYSPGAMSRWVLPIDIYFDDAMHANPVLAQNINFWSRLIKPGGYLAGHDYSQDWPDVMSEAERMAREWGSRVETCETLWWVQRPA